MKSAIALGIFLAVFLAAHAGQAEKKLWAKSFLNQRAPDLAVEKWLTDQPDLKGKFVLLDYWATWCPPCRKAIPELNAFQKQFKDHLVVIGISNEPEAKVRALTNPKIEYFSAIDTRNQMKSKLEVRGIPHVILVDPDWVVRWEGFPLLEGHELTASVIADLIAKHGPKP